MSGSLAFCEPKWASPYSRIHIRETGGTPRTGGGVDTPALWRGSNAIEGGWDIPRTVTVEEIVGWVQAMAKGGWQRDINPLCGGCAEKALEVLRG